MDDWNSLLPQYTVRSYEGPPSLAGCRAGFHFKASLSSWSFLTSECDIVYLVLQLWILPFSPNFIARNKSPMTETKNVFPNAWQFQDFYRNSGIAPVSRSLQGSCFWSIFKWEIFICSAAWCSNFLYMYQVLKDWKNKLLYTSNGGKLLTHHILVHKPKLLILRIKRLPNFTEHKKFWSLPRENKLAQSNNNHLLCYGAALLFPSLLSCRPFLRIVYQSWKWQKEELHPTPQVWRKKPQEFQFCLMGSHVSMLLTLKNTDRFQPGR